MENIGKAPAWYWVIAVAALLWNFMGAFDFTMSNLRADFYMSQFTAEQREYFYSFPLWAIVFWAMGVFGAFFGSVLLLFKSRFAVIVFAISIVGLLGTTVYQRVSSDLPESMATTEQNLFAAAIWVITTGLLLFSIAMRKRGILQ